MCPKGDDPLTPHTDFATVVVMIEHSAVLTTNGTVKFLYNGQAVIMSAGATEAECKTAIESLNNVETVSCELSPLSTVLTGGGANYTVKFRAFPLIPMDNNIFTNDDGHPTTSQMACAPLGDAVGGTVTCSLYDTTPTDALLPGMLLLSSMHCVAL